MFVPLKAFIEKEAGNYSETCSIYLFWAINSKWANGNASHKYLNGLKVSAQKGLCQSVWEREIQRETDIVRKKEQER